jgi:hypothetical protein
MTENLASCFVLDAYFSGVRFPGLIHPGLIGTAPSKELLDIWNTREAQLEKDGADAVTLGAVLHTRPLANLPKSKGALLGKVAHFLSLFISKLVEYCHAAGPELSQVFRSQSIVITQPE